MVTKKQVETGALNCVKLDMAPILPGWQGVLFGSIAQLNMSNWIKFGMEHPLLAGTGAVTENTVDIDKVYSIVKENARGKWPIVYENKFFNLSFSEGDLDKLYRNIKEAQV